MALGGRVAGTAASVTLTVVTARALGPSDRGVFVLAILVGFLASVVVRAASPALAYDLAQINRGAKGAPEALVADSWRASALLALLAGVPVTAIVALAGWGPEVAMIMAATMLCAVVTSTPIGVALANGRMARLAILSAGYPVAGVVGALLALALGDADLAHVAIGWSLGALAGAVAGVDAAPIKALRSRRRARTVRRQARFSLKSAGSTLVGSTANRMDVLVLGLLSTTTAVGLYSVAVGASELVLFAGEALAMAAYGRIGAGLHRDAVRATWRLCALATAAAAVQALLLAVVAHDAMAFVFGEQFRVSGDYLQILLVGSVLAAPIIPVSNYLTNQLGRPLLGLLIAATTLVASGLVCLFAIPSWGAAGAALGSTTGCGIGALVALALLLHTGRARDVEHSAATETPC